MALLLLAWRNLLRRRLRTTLTAAGIAMGVALVFVLSSLVAGTADQVGTAVRALGGADLTIYNGTSATTRGEFLLRPTGTLDASWDRRVLDDPRVQRVATELFLQGQVGGLEVPMAGVDGNYTAVAGPFNVVGGQALAPNLRGQLLLGRPLAEALGLAPGSRVVVSCAASQDEIGLTVVGTFETGISFLDRAAYLDLADAQALAHQPGLVTAFLVKLRDPGDAAKAEASLSAVLPGTRVVTLSSVLQRTTELLDTLTLFFALVGVVALAAGSFGMVNTMVMAVAERNREVGTLKALGATDGDVLTLVATEALLLGFLGAVGGVLLGLATDILLPSLGRRLLHLGQATLLAPVVTPSAVLTALALGTTAGLLAGIYPAWRAARLPPAEALRHG